MTTVGVSYWIRAFGEIAGIQIPTPLRIHGGTPRWNKDEVDAFLLKLRESNTASALVTASWWASALNMTTTAIANMVRRGRRGRGWDPRIFPPLDLPGHARWRRSAAIAHIQRFQNEGVNDGRS